MQTALCFSRLFYTGVIFRNQQKRQVSLIWRFLKLLTCRPRSARKPELINSPIYSLDNQPLMTTFTHLCRYIDQQFTLLEPDIKPYHRLQTDLGLNAMEVTEVVVFLELLYGVTLPDETLTPSLSVTQLCSLIEQYRESQQPDSAFLVYRNPRQVFSRAS